MKYRFKLNESLKKELHESVHIYQGQYVDPTTFLDKNGQPMELKFSNFKPQEQQEKQKPKIIIDRKTGKRKIYEPKLGRWRDF